MESCDRKIGPYDCCSIITGDAKELALALPDGSVDLIFCDPVYDRIEDYRWLAETAVRTLKSAGALLAFCGIGYLEPTLEAIRLGGMPIKWLLSIQVPGAGSRVRPTAFCNWQALLWCGGDPIKTISDAQISKTAQLNGNHKWKKNMWPMVVYTTAFTHPNSLVVDFFTGEGTEPAVCKMLGRHWLAFEIDPEVAERARERVRNTQPPLPGLIIEQTAMEL